MTRRERLGLVLVGVGVTAVAMAGIRAPATYGAQVTADEPQYLLTALSLGEDFDLDISDELAREAYRDFHRVDLSRQTYPVDAAGRQLSPHDPLLPLLLAVPMRLGGWLAAKAAVALMAGVLASLTAWTAWRRFGVSYPWACAVVGGFACTAPLAVYGSQIYPEIAAALAVMTATAASTGRLSRAAIVTCIAAIASLPWLSIKYSAVAAALAGLLLWRLHRDGRRAAAAATVATLAVFGMVYAVVHHRVYGGWTAYATGDHFIGSGEIAVVGSDPNYAGRARRLVGLLVDDTFGLAAWMPGWLLLPMAVGAITKARPQGWPVLVLPLAAGWLVATFVAYTMHGWWWPGRQVVVVLPLAVVAIAWTVDRVPAARLAFLSAAALGLATWTWSLTEAITRRHVLIVDFDHTANPWYRLWRLGLPDGRSAALADELLTAVAVALVVLLAKAGWARGSRIVSRKYA